MRMRNLRCLFSFVAVTISLVCCTTSSWSIDAEPAQSWNWIWATDNLPAPDTVYFRETFRLPAAPSAATLQITADDSFTAYINGDRRPVGQGTDWTTVQQFNVTKLLVKG